MNFFDNIKWIFWDNSMSWERQMERCICSHFSRSIWNLLFPFGHIFASISTAFNRHTHSSSYIADSQNTELYFHILVQFFARKFLFILHFQLWPVCQTYIGPSCRDQNWNNWLKQLLSPQQTTDWCCLKRLLISCFGISFTSCQCCNTEQCLRNISRCEIFAAIPAFVVGASTCPFTSFQRAFVQ